MLQCGRHYERHLEYIKDPKIQILLSHILSLVLQDLSLYRAKVTASILQIFFKAQSKWCFIVNCSVTRKKKKALGAQKLGFESITDNWGLSGDAVVKNPSVNAEDARDVGLIPGSGRASRV